MGDITISSAVRTNLLTLQNTASLMAQTQNRLATGLKVSSALDNPQSFFTAAGLSSRATDMSALLDSMSLGVQTLKAADEGIKSIQKLVDQAKSVANQALQAKATVTTLDKTATAANLTGSAGAQLDFTITIGTGAAQTASVAAANYTTGASAAAATKAAIDGLSITGLTVTVSGADISFSLESGEDIALAGNVASVFGLTTTGTQGQNGETLAEARATFATDYNNLLAQIDQLSLDTSFNGINLLSGNATLDVMFNESSTSKLTIQGVDFNAAGLGLAETTFSDINAEVTKLNTATADLRKQSSTFGANLSVVQNRQDFTNNMINVLEAGAGNLTLADTNVEAANLLALQTRQSLATTSLSLANQSEQSVLQLLR